MPHKLYCFVDESENKPSQVFIVAVVVTEQNIDELSRICEEIELASGKGRIKWRKAAWAARLRYIHLICTDERFQQSLTYAVFHGERDFHSDTLHAIERAIASYSITEEYRAWIYVDGLSKEKRHIYANSLRKAAVPVYLVRGIAKDENSALIRLADALAGLVNDALTSQYPEAISALKYAISLGIVIEI